MSASAEIISLDAPVADTALAQLAAVLVDCVEGGASVNFMSPFSQDQALAFFRKVAVTVAAGDNSIEFENTAGTVSINGSVLSSTLVLSPGALSYSCVSGGSNPAAQTVSVSASNGTLDNWSAAKTQSWLTLSPAGGSAAGNFTASVNCAGQPVGTQTDTITVSSTTTGIANSPQTVAVSLTVSASLPSVVSSTISGNTTASGNVTVH